MNTSTKKDQGKPDTISIPFIFLCLFTLSNFFSPNIYLGPAYARLPFILVMIAAISYIILQVAKGKPLVFLSSPIIILIFLLLFALYGTYFQTVDIDKSKTEFETFSKGIVLCIIISQVIKNLKEFKIYTFVLMLCGVINAYKHAFHPIWKTGRAFIVGPAIGGDPNVMSLIYVYTLPLVVALILLTNNKIIKACFFICIAVLLLAIIEAQSRGGFLGLIVVTCFGIMQIENLKHRFVGGFSILCAEILFFLRYAPPTYLYRMQEIYHPETDATGSAEHRMSAMQLAFDYTLSHPFSEYGLGNHSYYILSQYGVSVSEVSNVFGGSFLAHNTFLQLGADLGLIPLLFYLFFIVLLFLCLRKSKKLFSSLSSREAKEFVILGKFMFISLIGLLAGSFFLAMAYVTLLFYIAGCCIALYSISEKQKLRLLQQNKKAQP